MKAVKKCHLHSSILNMVCTFTTRLFKVFNTGPLRTSNTFEVIEESVKENSTSQSDMSMTSDM